MKGKIIENIKVHVGTNLCGGASTLSRKKHGADFRFYPESPVPMGVVVKHNGNEQFIPFTNITHVDLVDAPKEEQAPAALEQSPMAPAEPAPEAAKPAPAAPKPAAPVKLATPPKAPAKK